MSTKQTPFLLVVLIYIHQKGPYQLNYDGVPVHACHYLLPYVYLHQNQVKNDVDHSITEGFLEY